jgi:hypothetical protein
VKLPRVLDVAPDVDAVWDEKDVLRRGWLALGAAATGMAWVLLAGDPLRVAGPSFAVIRQYGGATTWGLVFGALAASMLAGRGAGLRPLRWAFTFGGVLYLLWSIALIEAVRHDPHAALTGPIVYFAVAVLHISHSLDYRVEKLRPPPELGESP